MEKKSGRINNSGCDSFFFFYFLEGLPLFLLLATGASAAAAVAGAAAAAGTSSDFLAGDFPSDFLSPEPASSFFLGEGAGDSSLALRLFFSLGSSGSASGSGSSFLRLGWNFAGGGLCFFSCGLVSSSSASGLDEDAAASSEMAAAAATAAFLDLPALEDGGGGMGAEGVATFLAVAALPRGLAAGAAAAGLAGRSNNSTVMIERETRLFLHPHQALPSSSPFEQALVRASPPPTPSSSSPWRTERLPLREGPSWVLQP